MPHPSQHTPLPQPGPRESRTGLAGWSAAALVAVALVATGALWAHYGTAVFFETIAAGIAACF